MVRIFSIRQLVVVEDLFAGGAEGRPHDDGKTSLCVCSIEPFLLEKKRIEGSKLVGIKSCCPFFVLGRDEGSS